MCLGIPGKIIEILPDQPQLATVDVAGVKRKVNVGLLSNEGVQAGDWVLIHVGFAMSKIDAAEARSTLRILEGMGEAFSDEIEALKASIIE